MLRAARVAGAIGWLDDVAVRGEGACLTPTPSLQNRSLLVHSFARPRRKDPPMIVRPRARDCALLVGLLCIVLPLAACATFSQRYFIEVEECRPGWTESHSTFVRLDLRGYTFFTVSKFEKGWYDRNAVDTLFSTVTAAVEGGPEAGAATRVPTPASHGPGGDASEAMTPAAVRPAERTSTQSVSRTGADCPSTEVGGSTLRQTRVFGPNGREIIDAAGKRLVIFVTGNPNDIVNQISTTVNNEETARIFAGLLRRNEVAAAVEADNTLDLTGRRHEALVIDTERLLAWLSAAGATPSVAEARRQLSGAIKTVDVQLQSR